MTSEELKTLLQERVNTFELKKKAFDCLNTILLENANDKDFLSGFEPNKIKTIFNGYQFHIDRQYGDPIIRTRIDLCVENKVYLNNAEPIGHYELETDLNGEIVDDWLVIEQEKYLKI